MPLAEFLSQPNRRLSGTEDSATLYGYDDGSGKTTWFTGDGILFCITKTPEEQEEAQTLDRNA